MHIDLLIHNAAQVVTCATINGAKRGPAMADVGVIAAGAVAVSDGRIVAVGPSADLRADFNAAETIDAAGQVVCPGFVDPHTHVVYAGDRVAEFEMRIKGASYMEIMAAGGGILNTMRATRAASLEQLAAETYPRLAQMMAWGTTTAEVKSGYGLETATELKMLQTVVALDETHPLQLIPTFMGAHAIPPEYQGDSDGYVDLVIEEMIPTVSEWYHHTANDAPLFCDVFCEAGVFSRAQSRRVLLAGRVHGLSPKIHADEFENLGGVSLAVELNAVSVDHLDVTPQAEMSLLADSNTVGVVLPAVNFNLGSTHFADARTLIDTGAAIALSTDINPGSAPCPSMPLVMAIATRYQHFTPAEALNAATINAACALGLDHQIGSLQPGKQADLLLLDIPDYRHLAYHFGVNPVQRVLKQGLWVS